MFSMIHDYEKRVGQLLLALVEAKGLLKDQYNGRSTTGLVDAIKIIAEAQSLPYLPYIE